MQTVWAIIRRTNVPLFGLVEPTTQREFVNLTIASEQLGYLFLTREMAETKIAQMQEPGHAGGSTLGFDVKLSAEPVLLHY